ncbi:leucine-rich repeat and calponin homology domain-containing protein isoform X2 [Anopheles aquasalis]|uniref:leucine-rich repeat and calponin homology domain-containing protein isoform X2 n=1 Tax=Anopheles aquasalis TaxID=42839 RepID=UPI00215B22F0|nr:leucine-rich repeat and calponin homology domain-containing protein isoform X2 [Anopheles aquasalis]
MAVACLKASQSITVGYAGPAQSSMHHHHHHQLGAMNGIGGAGTIGGGHLQSQLTRSLERILEDAHLSGELKLSGRKLKDFPKAAGKYNLSDTVIADLSRNRFCELPEDITCLAFLERLLVYHNTIRSVPETIRGLHSLTYLDLRNNQLSVLPREVCTLPLQVLLVSNNRLTTLPDEFGRMEKLTELDAACNQITHLPGRMGDLRNLRSLNLRSNQLVYLPRDLTCLELTFLDISSNKIATLPIELRLMSSLVDLELLDNPLTSPPASLCVRGMVHVFKYLETVAAREEKSKTGSDGHATLRRSALSAKNSGNLLLDSQRNRRAHVDSGYCTSDGGYDGAHLSAPSTHAAASNESSCLLESGSAGAAATASTDETGAVCWEEEFRKNALHDQHPDRKPTSSNNSNDMSPEGDFTPDGVKSDDKSRSFSNYQTYREYKEALRQQRNLDSVYRSKEQPLTPDSGGSATDSPLSNVSPYTKSISSSSVYSSSNQSSPVSPLHATNAVHKLNQINANGNYSATGASLPSPNRNGASQSTMGEETSGTNSATGTPNKRPVQKVIPSRNISSSYQSQSPTHLNGNHQPAVLGATANAGAYGKIPVANGSTSKGALTSPNGAPGTGGEFAYVKPNSPCKVSGGILVHNNVPPSSIPKPSSSNGGGLGSPVLASGQKPLTATVGYVNNAKPGQKTNKTVSWNRDVPTEKLSFTMRREFDKQKEETELIEQLRHIIEARLKMTLPEDIAPALMDGVVLCHLANHVRPRSVGSIHVPSSAVPKLTMARCRRNVDYFLDACRKIGVDEELICSCQDIVPSATADSTLTALEDSNRKETGEGPGSEERILSPRPPNPIAMYRTIMALLDISAVQMSPPSPSANGQVRRPRSPPPPPPPLTLPPQANVESLHPAAATNTNSSTVPEKSVDSGTIAPYSQSNLFSEAASCGERGKPHSADYQVQEHASETQPVRVVEDRRNVPVTLDLHKYGAKPPGRKRKFPSSRTGATVRRNHMIGNANDVQSNLNEIIEECEYDSDIGKFRCRTENFDGRGEYEDSETSLTSCEDDRESVGNESVEDGGEPFTPINSQPPMIGPIIQMSDSVSNDLDTPTTDPPSMKLDCGSNDNFNIIPGDEDGERNEKRVVTKRIEFFENAASTGRKILNSEQSNTKCGSPVQQVVDKEQPVERLDNAGEKMESHENSINSTISTVLCLGTFLFTVIYLYFYPLSA